MVDTKCEVEDSVEDLANVWMSESPQDVVEKLENHISSSVKMVGPMCPHTVMPLLGDMESGCLYLSPRDYADFRMFGRDCLDLNLNPVMLEKGYMGEFERVGSPGISVVSNSSLETEVAYFAKAGGKGALKVMILSL